MIRRVLATALPLALLAACTAPSEPPSPSKPTPASPATAPSTPSVPPPRPSTPADALSTAIAADCPAPRTDRLPRWATAAPQQPYLMSREGNAVGVLWVPPLRAGTRAGNKILWVVREPREGRPLIIVAIRPGAPTVTLTRAADSGPGEIYPSIVDVPAAGCWQLTLTWGTHRATVGVRYTG